MQPWKTLSRKTILDCGDRLKVEHHEVELPDGQIIDDWIWINSPDFAIVVAVTQSEKFLIFRQMKYGVGGLTLAPVGGYLHEEEKPLEGAKRELREETGYSSDEWISLGDYCVGGNRNIAKAHLFLALNARFVGETESDDLEEMELLHLSRKEVESALEKGEFKALAWGAAVAMALLRLDARD